MFSSTHEVLQRRAQLAVAFAHLKNFRPTVPFWKLDAHRIPVLWSLYRGLLKVVPGENTRWRVKMIFEQHKHLMGPKETKAKLEELEKMLNLFRAARAGDCQAQRIAERYESMIKARREIEHMKTLLRRAWAWQHRLDHRPILTGGLLRPSNYNRPLPRMRPQPSHVTMMFARRKIVGQRRIDKYDALLRDRVDMRREQRFETALAAHLKPSEVDLLPSVFRSQHWDVMLQVHIKYLKGMHWKEIDRAKTTYPESLLLQIRAARKEKSINKLRESQRLLRGEVLPAVKARSAASRMRRRSQIKGPPAHILANMDHRQKRVDCILREPSEGGYSGQVKLAHGMKLRNGEQSVLEEGKSENGPWLDAAQAWMRDVNIQKRENVS